MSLVYTPFHIRDVIQKIKAEKDTMEFMKTRWSRLDEYLDGGLLRKELIVIGAHTGSGKSILGGQLMLNIAMQGFKCAYFSLEISNEMLVARMIGSLSNIKPTRIRTGFLTKEEFERRIKAEAELEAHGDMFSFYDNLYTLDGIIKEIRENQYEFIVVDFIQNVVSPGNDEYSRLSRTALALQGIAKEVNGTVLALSQLSNMVAREGGRNKSLEYKGSGSIAMVCDLGFFIERQEVLGPSGDNKLVLSLRKNRRGPSGEGFELIYQSPGGLIYE